MSTRLPGNFLFGSTPFYFSSHTVGGASQAQSFTQRPALVTDNDSSLLPDRSMADLSDSETCAALLAHTANNVENWWCDSDGGEYSETHETDYKKPSELLPVNMANQNLDSDALAVDENDISLIAADLGAAIELLNGSFDNAVTLLSGGWAARSEELTEANKEGLVTSLIDITGSSLAPALAGAVMGVSGPIGALGTLALTKGAQFCFAALSQALKSQFSAQLQNLESLIRHKPGVMDEDDVRLLAYTFNQANMTALYKARAKIMATKDSTTILAFARALGKIAENNEDYSTRVKQILVLAFLDAAAKSAAKTDSMGSDLTGQKISENYAIGLALNDFTDLVPASLTLPAGIDKNSKDILLKTPGALRKTWLYFKGGKLAKRFDVRVHLGLQKITFVGASNDRTWSDYNELIHATLGPTAAQIFQMQVFEHDESGQEIPPGLITTYVIPALLEFVEQLVGDETETIEKLRWQIE